MKVVVYTSPTCTYCHIVEIFLKKNNIAFEEIDITKDKKAKEEVFKKTGYSTIPITLVGKEYVLGWDREKLKKLLGL